MTRLSEGNPGDCKRLGEDLWELRLTYGPGYRIYYRQVNPRLVVLLLGGDKDSQGTDIDKARVLAKMVAEEQDT